MRNLRLQSRKRGMNPRRRRLVHRIRPREWHGYAMGQDVYAESREKLLDKIYRMEHAGLPRPKRRRNPNDAKTMGKSLLPTLIIGTIIIAGIAYAGRRASE